MIWLVFSLLCHPLENKVVREVEWRLPSDHGIRRTDPFRFAYNGTWMYLQNLEKAHPRCRAFWIYPDEHPILLKPKHNNRIRFSIPGDYFDDLINTPRIKDTIALLQEWNAVRNGWAAIEESHHEAKARWVEWDYQGAEIALKAITSLDGNDRDVIELYLRLYAMSPHEPEHLIDLKDLL